METKKKYVLYENTLAGMYQWAQGRMPYDKEAVYSTEIDRSDLSEEQQKLQKKNIWYAYNAINPRMYYSDLEKHVEDMIFEEVLKGHDKSISNLVFANMMATKVRVVASFDEWDDGDYRANYSTEYGERTKDAEYVEDNEEFREKLQKTKSLINSFDSNREYVYAEKVEISPYPYSCTKIKNEITKAINRVVRNKLTYCLKKDVVIIPKEYLEKGKAGIEEWREIKSSKNKSNSIENKLIRETIDAKKKFAYDCVVDVMSEIVLSDDTHDWTMPHMTIDGRYNKQRTKKLALEVLGTKDKQKIIEMPEEEILEKAKEHWKKILMKAYNKVEKLEIKHEG